MRAFGILLNGADTFIRHVSAANSDASPKVIDAISHSTRYARRSVTGSGNGWAK